MTHVAGLLAIGAALGFLGVQAPGPAVGAAGGALAVALAIARPHLATLALVAAVWLDVPGVAVEHFGAPVVAGAAFPVLLAVPLLHAGVRGDRWILTPGFAALAAFAAVQVVSTAASAHPDVALEQLQQFALEGLLLYPLVVNAIRTPQVLREVSWTLLACAAALALVSVHQQLTGSFDRPYGGFGLVDASYLRGQTDVARLGGPLGDPNYYAQVLMAVVPIGMLAASGERRPVLRLAAAVATALVLVAVALTSSRGAAVAFLVVLLGLAALGHLRVRHLAAAAACVALVLALVPSYRERVTSIAHVGGATAQVGTQTSTDESVRSRTTEMLAAGLAFADHPVVGVGPGGFPFVYERYARRVGIEIHSSIRWGPQAGQVPQREAHNLLLGVAADLGFAGAAAFVAVVGIAIGDLLAARRRWRRRDPELVRLADGLLLALLAYLAAGAFLSLGFERYLWLLVALAGAAGAMARRGVA